MQPRTHLLLQRQNRAVTRSCKTIASLTCAQHSCDNVFLLGIPPPAPRRLAVAPTGAFAATLGRFLLAKMSRWILRNHWLSESGRTNVDARKAKLAERPELAFGAFLFYAFAPLPSNYLFIVYGLQ